MELGKFKTIALRKKWPNEASDFTPWLANNIDSLSEEIGIELEIENTEVAVGPYFSKRRWNRHICCNRKSA
jgi:hypothetical protein